MPVWQCSLCVVPFVAKNEFVNIKWHLGRRAGRTGVGGSGAARPPLSGLSPSNLALIHHHSCWHVQHFQQQLVVIADVAAAVSVSVSAAEAGADTVA